MTEELIGQLSKSRSLEVIARTWAAAQRLDGGWGITARAVRRGLARRPREVVRHVGVGEQAIAKRHTGLTAVADRDQSRVLYLADQRQQESLGGFGATLTPEQLSPSCRASYATGNWANSVRTLSGSISVPRRSKISRARMR